MLSKFKSAGLAMALTAAICGTAAADSDEHETRIPRLDHVFVIMMENHSYSQIVNNPNAPFINQMLASGRVNVAANYYGVGHPSFTNYIEVLGGSNFGIRSDSPPDWHNASCQPNIVSGLVNADAALPPPSGVAIEQGPVCPISGHGSDADTPAIDTWNEVTPGTFNFLADLDGVRSVAARHDIQGISIADQLVAAGLSWKSYEESLPASGANNVDFSNGTVTDQTIKTLPNAANLPASPGGYVQLYAATGEAGGPSSRIRPNREAMNRVAYVHRQVYL